MTDQPPPPPPPPTEPVAPGPPPPPGSATWSGVETVVERPTEAMPPVPPPEGPPAPPSGEPLPPPGPPPGGGKSKAPLIIVAILVLAGLAAAAFFLLGGDDDEVAVDDDTTTTEVDDETTTTEEGEETTTTEGEETTTTEGEETTTTAGGSGELTFVEVSDDTGQLVVEVPDTWVDVDGRSLEGTGFPNVQAAPDLAAFLSFGGSGVSYTRIGDNSDPDATLDFFIENGNFDDGCNVDGEREDYADARFTGRQQQFDECQEAGFSIIQIVASDASGASVQLSIVLFDPLGTEVGVAEQIANTFNLTS